MREVLILIAGLCLAAPAMAAPDVTGTWITHDGEGAVEIAPCGGTLCGRIVWLKSPLGEDGKPIRDGNNPDAALRGRPVCGIEVLAGVPPRGDGWEGGWIYDPEEGARYSVAIAPVDGDTIAVTGFVGMKALGQTFHWHRAPATLTRCEAKGGAGKKGS